MKTLLLMAALFALMGCGKENPASANPEPEPNTTTYANSSISMEFTGENFVTMVHKDTFSGTYLKYDTQVHFVFSVVNGAENHNCPIYGILTWTADTLRLQYLGNCLVMDGDSSIITLVRLRP